jgi:TPR repeat protein
MLVRGLDVDQDKVEAEKLLRDAAGHGFAQAQNDLGFAIMHGDLATKDLVEAGMWCKLATLDMASPKISERAAVNLSNAMKILSLDQQDEVDNRAKKFQARPIPEIEPKVKDWQKPPDYRQEDGQFGH